MQVSTNLNALTANASLNAANLDAQRSIQKISTGSKISNAADNPGAVGAAANLKAEIASRTRVTDNINAGIGALQVMDSAYSQIQDVLYLMKETATAGASGLVSAAETTALNAAMSDYVSLIGQIDGNIKYNGKDLTTGTFDIQTGPGATDKITITGNDVSAATLAVSTLTAVVGSIATLDTAISTVSGHRTTIGAKLNALYAQANINTEMQSVKSVAYGNLVNVDYGTETANLASAQIRQSSSAAMLAQSSLMSKEMVTYLLKSI